VTADRIPTVLTGVPVLLVEDDEATRYAWQRYLSQTGATVKAAETVPEALQMLSVGPVRVLVTDLMLPGGDGVDLLARARALSPALLAIAITGFDDEGQRLRALRGGFDAYLAKPVDPRILVGEITALIGR
jgi:CheY-like chemotaxis protein